MRFTQHLHGVVYTGFLAQKGHSSMVLAALVIYYFEYLLQVAPCSTPGHSKLICSSFYCILSSPMYKLLTWQECKKFTALKKSGRVCVCRSMTWEWLGFGALQTNVPDSSCITASVASTFQQQHQNQQQQQHRWRQAQWAPRLGDREKV